MDHMWIPIDEFFAPDASDGCTELEVWYADNRRNQMCSCDLHWVRHQKRELPIYFRVAVYDE